MPKGTRTRSKSRSRSRGRKDRTPQRTYRPPVPEQNYGYAPTYDTPRNLADVPQNLYVANGQVLSSPESGLTDEGRAGPFSMGHVTNGDDQRMSAYQGHDPRTQAYHDPVSRIQPQYHEPSAGSPAFQGDDPSAYRMAENPYHGDVHTLSPGHRVKLNRWYQQRFPVLSKSISDTLESMGTESLARTLSSYDGRTMSTVSAGETLEPDGISRRNGEIDADEDYLRTKQPVAYLAIAVTSVQLLILVLQLTMCGLAPLDVNGFVGPYPDQFSEWGGKNAYLMLRENQWWRLITSSFLHVGIIHLLVNAFCQLEAIALFEREWGSFRWALVYIISSVGATAFSSFFDEDEIAVGSSGALMGLYGAKLAQVVTVSFFELRQNKYDDVVRMEQLSSVLCGMTLVFLLTAFSYIDWSAHMGGILCGFFAGIVLFSNPIQSCCAWFFWVSFGLLGLIAPLAAVLYYFVTTSEPDEDIADACEYFRSFFPENYDCNCLWQ
jgi:membrane associated rhomboid family serine protease